MAEPLVDLRDVRVQHGAVTVLDIPALEICEGEIVAIIGANRAGKSTLLRVLGLLEWPSDPCQSSPGVQLDLKLPGHSANGLRLSRGAGRQIPLGCSRLTRKWRRGGFV